MDNPSWWFTLLRDVKNFLIPDLYEYLSPRLLKRLKKETNEEIDEWEGFRGQQHNIAKIKSMYVSSLKSFIKVAREWGIEPILMTQFNRINLNDYIFNKTYKDKDKNQYVELYHQFNEIIRMVARSEGVKLVDLAADIPSNSENIYDMVHLNERGSILVAEILTNFFKEAIQMKN